MMANEYLEIRIWDVNHGCSTWIKLPNNENALLDCGNNSNFSPFKHLKFVWGIQDLKYLIISHPHLDHISDLINVDIMPPKILIRNPSIPMTFLEENLNNEMYSGIFDKYLQIHKRYSGEVPDSQNPKYPFNNGGVEIHNYYLTDQSDDLNDYSLVTFIKYGDFCFASGGDLTTNGWLRLINKYENDSVFSSLLKSITIFQASHHGRQEGFSSDLFKYCKPKLVLISDKEVQNTSVTPLFCEVTEGWLVTDEVTQLQATRHVLTTRKDGRIKLAVGIDKSNNNTYCKVTTKPILS